MVFFFLMLGLSLGNFYPQGKVLMLLMKYLADEAVFRF